MVYALWSPTHPIGTNSKCDQQLSLTHSSHAPCLTRVLVVSVQPHGLPANHDGRQNESAVSPSQSKSIHLYSFCVGRPLTLVFLNGTMTLNTTMHTHSTWNVLPSAGSVNRISGSAGRSLRQNSTKGVGGGVYVFVFVSSSDRKSVFLSEALCSSRLARTMLEACVHSTHTAP